MRLVSERGDFGRFAPVFATIALALVALFAIATQAQAAETIYWNNYSGDPDSIGFASPDGIGGGAVNLGGAVLDGTEGNAYDSVTNRFFVANDGNDTIVALNLDNSGGALFLAPGAPVESPEGLVVDPVSRTVYWINTATETISWARLDGSAGGLVGTGGSKVNAYRLSFDPTTNRLYWFDESAKTIQSVSAAGGSVSSLNTLGATVGSSASGIAVEPALGKVFWLNENEKAVSWASLAGTGGGDLPVSESALNGPYGLSVDLAAGRIYWANYSNGESRTDALGVLLLAGGSAPINVQSAPVDGPQDPVLLKPPAIVTAPAITRGTKAARAQLTCPTGTWAGDSPGAFAYRAPRSYGYQWTRGGAPIAGAIGSTLTATAAGSYACTVTATNQAGTAGSTSGAVVVKASKVKLSTKKKAKADAGDLVTFKVKAVNQGDLKAKSAKLCVKLPGSAKDDLKAPKCKKLSLAGQAKKTLTLKVKVKGGADEGTAKLTFQVKGSAGKAAKSKILVK